MSGFFQAGNTVTKITDRPNIIITYPDGADSSSAYRLSEILSREEINVCVDSDGAGRLKSLCPNGSWHMVIVHDGGISAAGFGIIEKIRRFSDVPVLTVSDECCEIYKIMALDKGADICMELPESNGRFEFKARVISMLRRYLSAGTERVYHCDSDMLVNGAIRIDRRKREVYCGSSAVRLTAIEYGIVEYLMENCGDVCTVDDIYRRVWNETPYSVRKTVVEHIRRIRCKLEPDPKNPRYIKVVFGVGYKMEKAG